MKYDVFISYSRKDTNIADKICDAFEKAGISFFIDRHAIHGGNEFPKVIAEAIMESQVFLFLASKNAYDSKFTSNEITFAFNKKPKETIVPYIIDNSELPIDLDFVFSSINRRYIDEHPIEPLLVNDILQLLNRKTEVNITPQKTMDWGTLKGKVVKYFFAVLCVIGILYEMFSGSDQAAKNSDGCMLWFFASGICFILSIVGYTSPRVLFCKKRKEVSLYFLLPMIVFFFIWVASLGDV